MITSVTCKAANSTTGAYQFTNGSNRNPNIALTLDLKENLPDGDAPFVQDSSYILAVDDSVGGAAEVTALTPPSGLTTMGATCGLAITGVSGVDSEPAKKIVLEAVGLGTLPTATVSCVMDWNGGGPRTVDGNPINLSITTEG
jgi:hypothetical protein